MMKVCKFGGSSSVTIEALENVKILSQDKSRRVLVFSAIGKEGETDQKLTDLLIALAQGSEDENQIIYLIKRKLNNLCEKINKKLKINVKIDKIIKKYNKNKDKNYLISRGEYLTTFVISKYLKIPFVPAEKIIYFKNNEIDYEKIKLKLKFYLNKYGQIIIPGFYGVDEKENVKLFSRGGSDVVGAICSKVLGGCTYENWTDVDGVKEVDPKIMNSKTILNMNYNQLAVMTGYDAKVVHKDCAAILAGSKIEMQVKNILNTNGEYTSIKDENKDVFFICVEKDNDCVDIIRPNGSKKVDIKNYKSEVVKIYKNYYKKRDRLKQL